jgi:hypothetical protein
MDSLLSISEMMALKDALSRAAKWGRMYEYRHEKKLKGAKSSILSAGLNLEVYL